MFVKESFLGRKLKGLSWRIFNFLENNGDPDFRINGEGMFMENLLRRFCNRQMVVFDIGGNMGEYSSTLLSKAEKYNSQVLLHIFEPTKKCFSVLDGKFSKYKNVHLNNFGVSSDEVVADIFYDEEGSGLASLHKRNLDYYQLRFDNSEEVVLRRVDKYIESNDINHLDFVKIDIEGHELKAFEGFGKLLNGDFIDFIQFEYGGANLDSRTSLMDLYVLLNDSGFDVAKVMPNGLQLRKYSPRMDNFQYSNYVAISRKAL